MKKSRFFYILGFSFLLSLVVAFNSKQFYEFLIKIPILTLVFYPVGALVEKLINSKKYIRLVIFLGLFFIVVVIISKIINTMFGINLPAMTPDHFRTNILTGQCSWGGGNANVSADYWYYKPDCSTEKKIKLAKKMKDYDLRLFECNKYCEQSDEIGYCNKLEKMTWGNGPSAIDCSSLTTCQTIECN